MTISLANAEVFKTNDKNKFNEKIHELERLKAKFQTKVINKGKKRYLLLLQSSQKYKNARFRRNRKMIHKGKLYYLQFETTNKKIILKARKLFYKSGFQSKHIKLLMRTHKKPQYVINYVKPKSQKWFELIDYSMAQSKLRLETHQLNSEYDSNFLDLHSGIEINSDDYNGKVMLRLNYLTEKNKEENFNDTEFEIDETYLNKSIGDGQLTVGKQLFSWGVFDEFSNFDRVNIKNLKRFIFDSGENFRRPITAIRYEHYISDWKFDTFYNFGIESGKMLNEDSIWFGVDRKSGVIRGGDTSVIDPNLIKQVSIRTNKNIDNGYGFRLSKSGSGDLSFTYLKAYADLPVLKFSNTLRSEINSNFVSLAGLDSGVELVFVNEDVFGIDYVRSIGDQLFKLELSYIPNTLVVDKELDLIEVPKARIAIGGDIEVDSFSTTIVWQVLHEEVLDNEELFLDGVLTQSIIQTSSRFLVDKLELGLRLILNHNDSSNYISPYANYDLNDSHVIGASYSFFSGSSDSFYGYHEDESFLALDYSYIF